VAHLAPADKVREACLKPQDLPGPGLVASPGFRKQPDLALPDRFDLVWFENRPREIPIKRVQLLLPGVSPGRTPRSCGALPFKSMGDLSRLREDGDCFADFRRVDVQWYKVRTGTQWCGPVPHPEIPVVDGAEAGEILHVGEKHCATLTHHVQGRSRFQDTLHVYA